MIELLAVEFKFAEESDELKCPYTIKSKRRSEWADILSHIGKGVE